jgi:uncharacterized membrane protein
VTITGTGFGATQGSSTVKFNGTTATPTSWSDTSIVVPVPSGATTGSIVVTTAAGQATSSNSFTVTAPVTPVITSLSLTQGPIGMGLTIKGSGFGTQQGTGTVANMNVVPGTWSDAQITVQVPSNATVNTSYSVQVTNASGLKSNSQQFLVVAPFGCSN